jgi:adenosylcobinamide kinase/adenosylcobinamide-phosphate guanylyltransferase
MGKLTLLTGGARSGKSHTAQQIAARLGGRVVYIATAQALDGEMQARIQQHRQERPGGWQTLEAPQAVGEAWRASGLQADVVILDCLTMLATNVILDACPDSDAPDEAAASEALHAELDALRAVIQDGHAHWLVVTNEVGMGLVPPYPLGRVYRDLLGWANRQLAAWADEVYLLVAGIPVPIHTFRS